MNKIYLVEQISRKGVTPEGVPIEDVETIGYFSNKKLVEKAKAKCSEAGIDERNVVVTELPLRFGSAQRYVFVLLYEYYLDTDPKEEYYCTFLPRASEEECLMLRNRMALDPRYRKATGKHYYESSDGFRILRYPINQFYSIRPMDRA